jgi:hypothetical protein
MATIEESILNGNTSGTIRIPNYTDEFSTLTTAINQLKGAVDALTLAMNSEMFGATASTVAGTLANSALGSKTLLKAIAIMNEDQSAKNAEGLTSIGTIASQLAGLSSTLAAGVATNQIVAADQINKNAFDKTATQAALKRNKLPEVTVTSENFLTSTRKAVTDASTLATQAGAAGLVTSTASSAISAASTYVVDLLPSKGTITNFFKTNIVGKAADTEGTTKRVTSKSLIDSVL